MEIDWAWIGKSVLVVGDCILDKYVKGYVERISPEAPIPILNKTESEYRLGGAANVALNIQRLGGKAILLGVCGDDDEAKIMEKICNDFEIECFFIKTDRPTTLKTRYVTENGVQLLRVDNEKTAPIDETTEISIMNFVKKIICKINGVVISDYSKGMITESVAKIIIGKSIMHSLPCIVDPSNKPYHIYANATLIKPNKKEAAEALGVDPREHTADNLAYQLMCNEKYDFQSVLVTAGADGMSFYESGFEYNVKSKAQEVFDVSGAGDTVTAVMALCLASEINSAAATTFASEAAAIAVSRYGTYAPSFEELKKRIGGKRE